MVQQDPRRGETVPQAEQRALCVARLVWCAGTPGKRLGPFSWGHLEGEKLGTRERFGSQVRSEGLCWVLVQACPALWQMVSHLGCSVSPNDSSERASLGLPQGNIWDWGRGLRPHPSQPGQHS